MSSSSFSDIYQGSFDGKLVALKSLRVHEQDRAKILKVSYTLCTSDIRAHGLFDQAFCEEASTWRSLQHANIVHFLGVSKVFEVCIVSLWMSNGTVPKYLQTYPTTNRITIVRNCSSTH